MVCRDWLFRLGGRRRDGQAEVVEVLGELSQGPLAGGVLGEGQLQQGCALGVEVHGADLSALVVAVADVEVAKGCFADCPAVARLLAHALDDLAREVS